MTAPTAWPWRADASPVRGPQGSVVVVAAFAVPDMTSGPVVAGVLGVQLRVMAAGVLAQLGARSQEISGAMLPMRLLDRSQAIATLVSLSDPPAGAGLVLPCPGFDVRTAHERLLEWGADAASGCAFVQGTVPAGFRAGALS